MSTALLLPAPHPLHRQRIRSRKQACDLLLEAAITARAWSATCP
jgi:hypothetical protein